MNYLCELVLHSLDHLIKLNDICAMEVFCIVNSLAVDSCSLQVNDTLFILFSKHILLNLESASIWL